MDKHNFRRTFRAIFFAACFLPATVIHLGPLLPVTAAYADVNARSLTGTYKFRSSDVDLQFSLKKLGGGVVAGRFAEVSGSLVLDGKRPQRSKIEMNVRLASVETGSARMTDFLKSGVMFNVKKYPTARFVSTRVDVSGGTQAKVVGLLTLKGQTHPVTMTVDLLSGGRKKVRLKADGSFNRSRYGMNLGQPIYANRVRLGINLTGKR